MGNSNNNTTHYNNNNSYNNTSWEWQYNMFSSRALMCPRPHTHTSLRTTVQFLFPQNHHTEFIPYWDFSLRQFVYTNLMLQSYKANATFIRKLYLYIIIQGLYGLGSRSSYTWVTKYKYSFFSVGNMILLIIFMKIDNILHSFFTNI
jgi:hypothetical protein